jgi:hypothetical protein
LRAGDAITLSATIKSATIGHPPEIFTRVDFDGLMIVLADVTTD